MDVPDFRWFPCFPLRYSIYSENFDQKRYFEVEKVIKNNEALNYKSQAQFVFLVQYAQIMFR